MEKKLPRDGGGVGREEPTPQATMKAPSLHRNITMRTNRGLQEGSKTTIGSSERAI